MKKILVSGLEGFTGGFVKAELESDDREVIGLVSDLRDARAVADELAAIQPDAVVHLAGVAFVGHGDTDAFYSVNLMGTQHLLSAVARSGKRPDCVLLASSANVYGNVAEGEIAETTMPLPANDYAVSKLAMEYVARLWFDKLPIVIVRPFNYTGVGQSESFLLPKIVAHFRRRASVIELGNLDVWRDFSDVRTVARIYRRLLECAPAGEVFNICSGAAYSLREVLAMMNTIAGYEIEVHVNPAFVRANEVKMLRGAAGKLKGLLGEWPAYSLPETLRWMYEAPA